MLELRTNRQGELWQSWLQTFSPDIDISKQEQRGRWRPLSSLCPACIAFFFPVLYIRRHAIPVITLQPMSVSVYGQVLLCKKKKKNLNTTRPSSFHCHKPQLRKTTGRSGQNESRVCKVPLFSFFFFFFSLSHTGYLLWLFQSVHCTWGVVLFWVRHEQ